MNFFRQNKTTVLIGLLVAVVLVGGYYYYFGNSSSGTTLTATPAIATTSGEDLLTDLSNLQSVKFNTSLFSDPGFTALVDFNVDIPPQPIGNADPFAPLPGTPVAPSTSSN